MKKINSNKHTVLTSWAFKYVLVLTLFSFRHMVMLGQQPAMASAEVQDEKKINYMLPMAITNHYLRSFSPTLDAQEKVDKEEQSRLKKEQSSDEHDVRPANLDAITLRKTIFLDILAKGNLMKETEANMAPMLNEYAWGDLKLFFGTTTEPSYNLIGRINRTKTVLGESILAILLVTPTNHLPTLQRRQAILQHLLGNVQILERLNKIVDFFRPAEQSIISMWTKADPLYTKEYVSYMEDKFYSKKNQRINKTAGILEMRKRIFRDLHGIQIKLLWPFLMPISFEIFSPESMTKKEGGKNITARKWFWMGAIPIYGGIYKWQNSKNDVDKVSNAIFGIIGESVYILGAYSAISNYLEYAGVIRNLAARMADVQAFIMTVEKISETIAKDPALEVLYGPHVKEIRLLLQKEQEKTEIGRLIQYLKTLPFNNWSYFFNSAGKLLACHKLFTEYKDDFSDAMYELGLLDAFLSFTKLLQEAKAYDEKHAYTFVKYLDRKQRQKPYIKIDEMWNLFLDAKQAVGNNLEMDSEPGGLRNMILTGPNAGGKSTFLTGVTNTILLAHVIGIGPANQIVITPFNYINTYIDIADDIAAGRSLFMAEVDRAQKHIKLLKSLKEDEFSFTIFDEPFSGTNPIEGAAAEYSILESLAKYTNSFTIVATHYPTVMLLEERAKDKGFANYKVYITRKGESRKLNYTYKIVPGKSNQAIAIDILEEQGYDLEMLERARDIIQHPEKYQSNF